MNDTVNNFREYVCPHGDLPYRQAFFLKHYYLFALSVTLGEPFYDSFVSPNS